MLRIAAAALMGALTVIGLPPGALAAPNRTVNIQGTVATAGGAPASGPFTVTFELYAAVTGGTALYTQGPETITVTDDGMFDATLGPLPAGVAELNPDLWLQTTVGADALPRQPLRTVVRAIVAGQADVALGLTCTGCVSAAAVSFPYAAGASKGGAATGLECAGCVSSDEIEAGAIAGSHLQAGVVTVDKVAFAYAGSSTAGGPATDVACTGCVQATDLAANLAVQGTFGVAGALSACTTWQDGCGVAAGPNAKLTERSGAWLHAQGAGLRVRTANNGAPAPLEFGGGTSYGTVTVSGGQLLVTGTAGIGTTSPNAQLSVAGGIQLANDTDACSSAKSGTLRWTGSALQICNGTAWTLISAPACTASSCDDGNPCTTDTCVPSTGCAYAAITPCCGNNTQESGEGCDDGNRTNGDGCSSTCAVESTAKCSNNSSTDCNPGGTTLIGSSAFVDADPPAGWTQCAGFVNTTGDDVGNNFMNNCLNTSRLRVKVWNTSTGLLEEDVYNEGLNVGSAWPNWNYLGGSGNVRPKYTYWTGGTTYFTTMNGNDACSFSCCTAAPGNTFVFGTGNGSSAIIAPGNTDSYEWRVNCGGQALPGRKIAVYR